MVEKEDRQARAGPRGCHDPERIRGANGNPIQRLHVLALIRRCLVVDLEVVVPQQLPQHVVHGRFLGGDHQIEESSAPLTESSVKASAATDGRTNRHRADGKNPNPHILFRCQERVDFMQSEQAGGITYQSAIREDTAVVARQRK